MERLTNKIEFCSLIECHACKGVKACYQKEIYDKMQNKLKDYEDAEENGEILRLPIPLGKPCYVLEKCRCSVLHNCKALASTDPRRKAEIIEREETYRGAFYGKENNCIKIYKRTFQLAHINNYGKTVFKTREDAIAAAKKVEV